MSNIFPVITLYQPWATWIMRGWKTIETRTHNRFASLNGKTILIHAGQTTDAEAINNPYLTKEQLLLNPDEMINGFILGSAKVHASMQLDYTHAANALIECETKRYGLFLYGVKRWEIPIKEKGEMGIWYYDIDNMMKVKKSEIKTVDLFSKQ
jgi:hypothetical protein